MNISSITYAKKLIYPSGAANVLQSLNMAYAFAENGIKTHFFPGIKGGIRQTVVDMESGYALFPSPTLEMRPLFGGHKGMYGLNFRARIAMKWLTSKPTDVFYARNIKEGLFIAKLKRSLGMNRPFFFEMHEILAHQHARKKTEKAAQYEAMEKELLAQVDGIISISSLLSDDIKDFYSPNVPIMTAPMGFNPRLYAPVPPINLNNDVTLAYAGSLYESKGVHSLLTAMQHLPERFRLIIMGGKPQEEFERLQSMAEEYHGRVEFTGHLTPTGVARKLKDCQIFVIPQVTTSEFFSPIKLYEAMGMALPIVTTPVPTIAKAVTHGKDAYVASGTEPEALARAILDLVENEKMIASIQDHARKTANRFTWQNRARQCLEFMTDTIG